MVVKVDCRTMAGRTGPPRSSFRERRFPWIIGGSDPRYSVTGRGSDPSRCDAEVRPPAESRRRARNRAALASKEGTRLLPRCCRAGIVHVNQLPPVPSLGVDLRLSAVCLNDRAVVALFCDEVPIELRPGC